MPEPLEHLDHVPGGGVGVLAGKVRQVLVNLRSLGDVGEALVAGVLVPQLLQWRHLQQNCSLSTVQIYSRQSPR